MTNAYYGFIQTLLPRRDQNCLYINIIIIGIIDYGSHFHNICDFTNDGLSSTDVSLSSNSINGLHFYTLA